jgi:hypothetical protein
MRLHKSLEYSAQHCLVAIVAHTKNQRPFWFAPKREKSGWCGVRPEGTARHCPSTARTRPLTARIAEGSEGGCGTGTQWWKTLQDGSHKHTCDVSPAQGAHVGEKGACLTFLVVHACAHDIERVVDDRDLVPPHRVQGRGGGVNGTLKERSLLCVRHVRCAEAATATTKSGNQVPYHDARCDGGEQVDQHAFLESCQARGRSANKIKEAEKQVCGGECGRQQCDDGTSNTGLQAVGR